MNSYSGDKVMSYGQGQAAAGQSIVYSDGANKLTKENSLGALLERMEKALVMQNELIIGLKGSANRLSGHFSPQTMGDKSPPTPVPNGLLERLAEFLRWSESNNNALAEINSSLSASI